MSIDCSLIVRDCTRRWRRVPRGAVHGGALLARAVPAAGQRGGGGRGAAVPRAAAARHARALRAALPLHLPPLPAAHLPAAGLTALPSWRMKPPISLLFVCFNHSRTSKLKRLTDLEQKACCYHKHWIIFYGITRIETFHRFTSKTFKNVTFIGKFSLVVYCLEFCN